MALIYIVEDNICTQEIEQFALRSAGYEVKCFTCAQAFYEQVEKQKPDLVLLDVMLPDEDGLSIVGKLRREERTEQTPVIFVTARTSEIDRVKGLDQGADDYLIKPFGVMELVSRVKALLRRSRIEEKQDSLSFGPIRMDQSRHLVQVGENICELTFKEYELLKLLLTNEGAVTSREMILERIWGTDFEGESRTLDMHIKTLRKKLGVGGTLIKTVRNVGYILEDERTETHRSVG